MYVCDDISVCRRRVCMCVMIFQCVGGECVCVMVFRILSLLVVVWRMSVVESVCDDISV